MDERADERAKGSTADGPVVSLVAQAIDLLGDRLTIAILRDAFVDRLRRFSEWSERTGAPPAVLTSRLSTLVEHGLMERRPQPDHPDRHDYLLTPLGLATWEFLVSIWSWQRQWSPDGRHQPEMVHDTCGHFGVPEMVCRHCLRVAGLSDVSLDLDPAALRLAAPGGRRRSTRTAPALARADLQFSEVMEAVGDRWSALVTGLALSGTSRFGEFQSVLHISPTTLTERLARLTAVGFLEHGENPRDYRLTPRGRALFPIFAFQLAWARIAHPGVPEDRIGPRVRHQPCGQWLDPALRCRGCEQVLTRTSVSFRA